MTRRDAKGAQLLNAAGGVLTFVVERLEFLIQRGEIEVDVARGPRNRVGWFLRVGPLAVEAERFIVDGFEGAGREELHRWLRLLLLLHLCLTCTIHLGRIGDLAFFAIAITIASDGGENANGEAVGFHHVDEGGGVGEADDVCVEDGGA